MYVVGGSGSANTFLLLVMYVVGLGLVKVFKALIGLESGAL